MSEGFFSYINAAVGGEGIPPGIICMWSGSSATIPDGWVLCDGNNNTPNLTGRFIIGANTTYTQGSSGGSASKTISTSNLPLHNHSATLNLSGLTASSAGAHAHKVYDATNNKGLSYGYNNNDHNFGGTYSYTEKDIQYYDSSYLTAQAAGSHTHTISGSGSVSIGNTGSGAALDIMPPYYALCYIMKL